MVQLMVLQNIAIPLMIFAEVEFKFKKDINRKYSRR